MNLLATKLVRSPVMDSLPNQQDSTSFNVSPIMNPPPQIFGDLNGSPLAQNFNTGHFFTDDSIGSLDETSEAKRRRIARVWEPRPHL